MSAPAGLAIFDLDGTLVDSRADLADSANAARTALGLMPLSLEEITGYVGDGVEKLVERITPVSGTQARTRALEAFTTAYRLGCCRKTRPYPGIPEALESLQAAGWVLGVATNKSLEFTERILAHCQLASRFAAVRGGDRARKPDPQSLNEIRTQTGSSGRPAWMIGDHHTDIRAGHAAGMSVAWVSWGFGRHDGLVVEAEVHRASDLPGLLLGVPGRS